MFKLIACFALISISAAAPGFIAQHHVIQPLSVAAVVYTAPSAISHQSHVQLHSNTHIISPVLKTVVPVVPVAHSYAAPAVLKTVHVAPVFKSVVPVIPVVPVLHAIPVLKTVVAAPFTHIVHH